MKFKRQQGHAEFGRHLPPSRAAADAAAAEGDQRAARGQAMASFYGSVVCSNPGPGWVSGGTLQDAAEGSRGGTAGPEAAAAAPAPAAQTEAAQPSHAGLGSAAAREEQQAEELQLQYDQPAGPLLPGEQRAVAGGAEQPPDHPHPQHDDSRRRQQRQRREPQERIQYGIARSNVGYRLLKQAGWTEGTGLGAQEQGVAEPVAAFQQRGNVGLGFAAKPPNVKAAGTATQEAVDGAGGAPGQQQQQQARPKRPLPVDPLDKESTEVKVKRVRQVMQAEADEKAGKAIARYIHMAFSDATGEPTRDSNPLLRRNHKLSATNPLL